MSQKKRDITVATAIGLIAICALFMFSKARAESSLSDFSQYWTACHLFRANPYDIAAENDLQIDLAANRHDLLIMRNPPWTALLFFPLAAFSYPVASALWAVITVILVFGSAVYFWRKLGGKDDLVPLVIAFSLAPTFILIDLAQITALLLAGAALFLVAIAKRNYWLAGVALFPFTFKPHLSFILLLIVFAWAVRERHWQLLLSFLAVMGTAVGVCFALNPHIGVQYFGFMKLVIEGDGLYPTLSGGLVAVTGQPWLKFVPPLAGAAFLIARFVRSKTWNWTHELPLLLSIGIACSFYSYAYDQILAIPLLLLAFLRGNRRVFVFLFVVANLAIFFYSNGPGAGLSYMFLWWTACAWPAIYYLSTFQKTAPLSKAFNAS